MTYKLDIDLLPMLCCRRLWAELYFGYTARHNLLLLSLHETLFPTDRGGTSHTPISPPRLPSQTGKTPRDWWRGYFSQAMFTPNTRRLYLYRLIDAVNVITFRMFRHVESRLNYKIKSIWWTLLDADMARHIRHF